MLVFNSGLWDGSSNSKYRTSSSLGISQVCLLRQEVGRGGRDDRSACAIWFANGRSLVKTITDEKIITIMKSSLQRKMCIRFSVLEHMRIKGMTFSYLQESEQNCTGNEKCQTSKYCTFCSMNCNWSGHISIKDEFGIP